MPTVHELGNEVVHAVLQGGSPGTFMLRIFEKKIRF